nr:unnamed protein product [Spirometra erinaceieuropaei]
MGPPLGTFLANVFVGKVEKTRLQDAINDLVFYDRYVDDIFCLADGTTDIEHIDQKFNSAHPSLKFTAESEADNEIAFLDVLLHRQEDGSIQRRVFRKKTWTGHTQGAPTIDTPSSPSTPSNNSDRLPEPPLPSSSSSPSFSTAATIAAVLAHATHGNTTHNPDTTTTTNTTFIDTRRKEQDYTCPQCDRTLTSHNGRIDHLRYHRADAVEPVLEAPT